jgi:hypothetical protein
MKALVIAALLLLAPAFAPRALAQLPQVPRNLDFAETSSSGAPPGWQFSGEGYSVVQRADCECAVISPGQNARGEATLFQSLDAVLLRGKNVVFDAELRVESGGTATTGRIWVRVNHPGKAPSVFDNLSGEALHSYQWTRSDLRFSIDADAVSLDLGIAVAGGGSASVRSVALEVDGHMVGSPFERMGPANLTFSRGEIGGVPAFWSVTPTSYSTSPVSLDRDRCFKGPVCASVRAPYSLSQSFGAIPYRNQVVRFHARIRSDGKAPDDRARLWMRTESPSRQPSFLMTQRTDFRDSASSEWTDFTLTHKVEDNALNLTVGITAFGGTVASIDTVTIDVVADSNSPAPVTPNPRPTAPPSMSSAEPSPVPSNAPSSSAGGPAHIVAEPSVSDQQHLITLAAEKARDYAAQLPNFMCIQMIQRSENHRNQGWRMRDMLTVQLGYADGQEHYKLLTMNNRPTNASYLSISGAISEGEFGSTLQEIFRPQTAKFLWAREETLRGYRVSVFSYQMLQNKSGYVVEYGASLSPSRRIVAAHHGHIFIDSKGEVLRIVREGDMPPGFPIRLTRLVLDYDFSDVAGRLYLLPSQAQIELTTDSLQTRNDIWYREYKKFDSDSTITFDDH